MLQPRARTRERLYHHSMAITIPTPGGLPVAVRSRSSRSNSRMPALRRLAWINLVLAFGHVVFGAIVRITGSGLGCGDHWPKCNGYWFPPLNRLDLIIEVTHRYLAATLSLGMLALLALALVRRRTPGVGGSGGVLRPAVWAAALVIAAALFGALTVKLALANKLVIVTHLAIAMATLGVLIAAVQRAGGLGSTRIEDGSVSRRTWRASRAAVAIAFVVLVMGALTAHLPGANIACEGFPLCRGSILPGTGQTTQLVHRLLAFGLVLHLLGLMIAARRRGERPPIVNAARVAFTLALLQIVIAAALVELRLPMVLRALHAGTGTLVWVAVFVLALLARRGIEGAGVRELRNPLPQPPLKAAEAR
jgi:heme A synthase